LILLIAGLGCGLVNTLASSGSAISLPVLLLFGLSPLDANATNRLTVLFGSLMALRTFQAKAEGGLARRSQDGNSGYDRQRGGRAGSGKGFRGGAWHW